MWLWAQRFFHHLGSTEITPPEQYFAHTFVMFCLERVPAAAAVEGVSLQQVHLRRISSSSLARYLRTLLHLVESSLLSHCFESLPWVICKTVMSVCLCLLLWFHYVFICCGFNVSIVLWIHLAQSTLLLLPACVLGPLRCKTWHYADRKSCCSN